MGVFSIVHHATSDGLRGQIIQAAMYDIDPDVPLDRGDEGVLGVGTRVPGRPELLLGAAREWIGMLARSVRTGLSVGRAGARTAGVLARSLGRDLPGRAPSVRFNGEVGEGRSFAYGSVPLAPLKAWVKATGGTVNDGILTLVGGPCVATSTTSESSRTPRSWPRSRSVTWRGWPTPPPGATPGRW